jgi:2Fe-2S ferredoxin
MQEKGQPRTVEVPAGGSLMEVATTNAVPGILAVCGGCCSCGTCHVHVDANWVATLPVPNSTESEMLEGLENRMSTSRLACQIHITDELDGLIVEVPA